MIRRATIVAALAVACTPPPAADLVGGGVVGEIPARPASHGPIPTADHEAEIGGSLADLADDEPSQTTMPIPTTTLPPPATTWQIHVATPVGHVQRRVAETWPEDPQTALAVAACESGYDTTETGRAGERGVMQIHPVHRSRIRAMGYRWADMHRLEPNLAVARAIWLEQGWRPWTCAR